MKKLFAGFLAASLMTACTLEAVAAVSYQDVPSTSQLAAEVEKSVNYQLMSGYNHTTFGYADTMTRAQFVTVLGRVMGGKTSPDSALQNVDVTAMNLPDGLSDTYHSAIVWAAQSGAVDTNVAFRPNDPITRGEMAELLVRALGLKEAASIVEKQNNLPFTDMSERKGYITIAYQIGMTTGTSATTFSPNHTATRGQAAAMLVRIYEKLHQKTDFVHGFYAISSYSQIGLTNALSCVSAGWSRMTWDGITALLSTTSANGNEYAIPSGYSDAASFLDENDTSLHLSVFMDASSGVKELLASKTGRAEAVEQIVKELTISYRSIGKNPYYGVTIDFEGLRADEKTSFNQFLEELSCKVKSLGKYLYVCVSPVLTTGDYYDGYDYRTIGKLADKVILMAYDYDAATLTGYENTEYYKTAAPAPIDQVYTSMLAIINKETGVEDISKVVLGFSNKPVAWKLDASGKLGAGTPIYPSMETVAMRLEQRDTIFGYSSAYQIPFAIYSTQDGGKYFLWYEDDSSAAAKLHAAKLLGITGVSLWRLGTIPTFDNWNWNSLMS